MSALNPIRVQKPPVLEKRSCHTKPVLESHLALLYEGALSDVTFIVGKDKSKERIPCHQLFLKARSPVFEAMFNERWNQDSSKEVVLEDFDPWIFKKFLWFIYADEFEVNLPEALELLQLAHMYDVQLLVSTCEDLLLSEVSVDTAVEVLQAARRFESIELMDKARDVMGNYLSTLQKLPSFSRVMKGDLKYILKRNDLKMKEVDLFHLAVQWAKNQADATLLESLQDILPLIRFPTMTLEEFTENVEPTGLISQSICHELLSYFGTDVEAKRLLASTLRFSTLRRQSTDSTVSVPLYSGDFVHSKTRREKYVRLKERLKIDIGGDKFFTADSPPSLLTSEAEKTNIVLSSVSFYCPKPTASTQESTTTQFQIAVLAETRSNESAEYLFTLFPLKIEEGKITEVEFDREVPMEVGVRYFIEVEELTSSPEKATDNEQEYEVRDFGKLHYGVPAIVGQKYIHLGNMITNEGSVYERRRNREQLQMIYKIGLKQSKVRYCLLSSYLKCGKPPRFFCKLNEL